MATLSEIAEKANVSIATVSRILNHDDKLVVPNSLKISVFREAHNLGYRTPRQKKANKTETIIAIADWHIIPPGEPIEYTISSIVPAFGIEENITFVRLEKNKEQLVDGIIALGEFSEIEKNKLLLSSSNILFINSDKDLDYSFDRIIIDFDIALEEAINYLEDNKCKKIAYIGGISRFGEITIGEHRTSKIKQLLIDRNLFSEELFLCEALKEETGARLMEKALSKGADSIIISSQIIEKTALRTYFEQKGNCKIILYRDIELYGENSTNFPTIRMYTPELWERAIKLLIDSVQRQRKAINVYIPALFDTNSKS